MKLHRHWKKLIFVFAFWTLFASFYSSQTNLSQAHPAKPVDWVRTFVLCLTYSYIWAAFSFPILYFAARFPIETGRRLLKTVFHIAVGSVVSILHLATYSFLYTSLLCDHSISAPFLDTFRNMVFSEFHFNLLIYLSIVGVQHAFDYYRRYRQRQVEAYRLDLAASELRAQLAQAQLEALKMQLHPHFLFNTLQTISVLMLENVETANRMLVLLSDMLRITLKNVGRQEVELRQELAFLGHYLEIEQSRFQERLSVRMQIDPAALCAWVPNLILQPLVENAIRHGIAPRASGGRVEILAKRVNGSVQLEVRDDGPGMGKEFSRRLAIGVGLSNTQARLEKLYGAEHRFELSNVAEGGFVAKIGIPFHVETISQIGC